MPMDNMLLQQAAPQQPNPLQPLAPPPQAPSISPEQVASYHAKLDHAQDMLKNLIRLPDSKLTLKEVLGSASDFITQNRLSKGAKGGTAMEIASLLASPDFPKTKPNGEDPSPTDIRKYLLTHFNMQARTQAKLTSKFGLPQPQPQGEPS